MVKYSFILYRERREVKKKLIYQRNKVKRLRDYNEIDGQDSLRKVMIGWVIVRNEIFQYKILEYQCFGLFLDLREYSMVGLF